MTKTQRIALWIALSVGTLALLSVMLHKHIEPEEESEVRGFLGGGLVPGGVKGDISGVTAGSGLTGGGTAGGVTLNIGAGSGLTVSADSLEVGAGSGLSVSADVIAVNIAGATCSNGQSITTLGATGTGTCGNSVANQYGGTHLEWVDEYLNRSTVASGVPYGIWSGVPAGTGAAVNGGSLGTTTRPGIAEFTTGTTTTGSASLQTNPQSVDFGSGTWNIQWTGGFPTLSAVAEEYAFLVGFSDATTVNVVDGCYLLYDRVNVATSGPNTGNADTWSCWCTANSTRTTFLMDGTTVSDETFTTVDSPIAALTLPSTNIYNIEVRMTGSTRAEFFINGTKRCNINTNIPTGSARLTGVVQLLVKSAGTTARTAAVDRTRVAVDLTTARSP